MPSQSDSLAGRRVLITSPEDSAARIAAEVRRRGGFPIIAPMIRRVLLTLSTEHQHCFVNLHTYQWLIFTSGYAVTRFFQELPPSNITDASKLPRIATVGDATAAQVKSHGWQVDCIASDTRAEGLYATLVVHGIAAGDRVLFPAASNARELLATRLHEQGVEVDVVPLYHTEPYQPESFGQAISMLRSGNIAAVTFTSPSAVHQFFELFSPAAWLALTTRPAISAIGKTTAEALAALDVNAETVPGRSSVSAMIEALVNHFSTVGRTARLPVL